MRICDVCGSVSGMVRHCYTYKNIKGEIIEEKCGHQECIDPLYDKIKRKINNKGVK